MIQELSLEPQDLKDGFQMETKKKTDDGFKISMLVKKLFNFEFPPIFKQKKKKQTTMKMLDNPTFRQISLEKNETAKNESKNELTMSPVKYYHKPLFETNNQNQDVSFNQEYNKDIISCKKEEIQTNNGSHMKSRIINVKKNQDQVSFNNDKNRKNGNILNIDNLSTENQIEKLIKIIDDNDTLSDNHQNNTNNTNSQSNKFNFQEMPTKEGNYTDEKRGEENDNSNCSYGNYSFLRRISENDHYITLNKALKVFYNGNWDTSIIYLQQAQNSLEEELTTCDKNSHNHIELMMILIQVVCYSAQVYRCYGKNSQAISQLEYILKKFQIHAPDVLGTIYSELAINYQDKLSYNKALDYYVKALAIYEKFNWKSDIAACLTSIAPIYAIFGQQEDAKKIGYCALEIIQNIQPLNQNRIADVYHTMGEVFYFSKEYDFAMGYLEKCLALREQYTPNHYRQIVKTHNLIAIVYMFQGYPEKAIEQYKSALNLYGEDMQISTGQICNNLALAYLDSGQLNEAKYSFNKAISIYKEFLPKNHSLIIKAQKNQQQIIELKSNMQSQVIKQLN